jgi:hypothetical protein
MATPIGRPEEEPSKRGAPATKDGRDMRKRFIGLLVGLAAVLAFGLISPSAASAAVERGVGKKCAGSQVIRCTWVNYDNTNGRVRAYAWVQDTPGARQYSVRVTNIQLVYKHPFLGYLPVPNNRSGDYDGWHPVTDDGRSGLVGCDTVKKLPGRTVYAQARFSWKGYSSGSQTLVSFPVKRC